MSELTTPLYKILRSNTHGYDLNTMVGLYNASMETVFDMAPLTAISSDYRQRFVTGFALHYFAREIGQETIPLWKISLADKIFNNAEYINEIFESLDKQVYANYRVHRGSKTDNSVETRLDIDDKVHADSHAKHHDDTDVANELNTSTRNTKNDTNESQVNTGVKGSETNDNVEDNGIIASTNSQDGTADDNGVHTLANNGVSQADSNAITGSFDTPMGSVANMRVPNIDLTGKGVSAVVDSQYNYMSGAGTSDGTTVTSNSGGESSADVSAHTDSLDSAGSQATHNESARDGEYNESHADTITRENEQNADETASALRKNDVNRTGNEVDSSTGNENAQATGSRANQGNSEYESTDYELTNEVVLRSLPFMEKIWRVFDPCFSLII